MADKKISQLTAATTPLAGTEVLPIVQSGSTVKVSAADITAGRNVGMAGLTATGNVSLDGGTFVFNNSGADKDFRIAGDTDANLFFTDASTDRVGIKTNTPSDAVGIGGTGGIRFEGWNANRTFLEQQFSSSYYQRIAGDSASRQLRIESVSGDGGASGSIALRTNSIGTVADTMVLGGDGNVTVSTGNIVQGTAAKGINFSANTGAAGKTSSLLNWYEEGTWTPTVSSASGTTTGTDLSGKYTRIGRMVWLTAKIGMTTDASVGTSDLTIGGLPFTANNEPWGGQWTGSSLTSGDYGTGGAVGVVTVGSTSFVHRTRTIDISSRSTTFYWYYSLMYQVA